MTEKNSSFPKNMERIPVPKRLYSSMSMASRDRRMSPLVLSWLTMRTISSTINAPATRSSIRHPASGVSAPLRRDITAASLWAITGASMERGLPSLARSSTRTIVDVPSCFTLRSTRMSFAARLCRYWRLPSSSVTVGFKVTFSETSFTASMTASLRAFSEAYADAPFELPVSLLFLPETELPEEVSDFDVADVPLLSDLEEAVSEASCVLLAVLAVSCPEGCWLFWVGLFWLP